MKSFTQLYYYCILLLLIAAEGCTCNDPKPDDGGALDTVSETISQPDTTIHRSFLRNNPDSSYYLVSSLYGEIKTIIVCSNGIEGSFANRYYEGARAKFGEDKVKAMVMGVQLNTSAISSMSQEARPGAPQNVSEVLKSFMGERRLANLIKSDTLFKNIINKLDLVKKYTKIKATQQDMDLLKTFDKAIIDSIKDYTIQEWNKGGKKILKKEQLAVVTSYSQVSALTSSGRTTFWLQDLFNVLQTDNENDTIILVYSTCIPQNKETVETVIDQLKRSGIKLKSQPTDILFPEGGNILSCGNFVLIGKNILYKNFGTGSNTQRVPDTAQSRIEGELKALFNTRHIIWTGNDGHIQIAGARSGTQPVFHIDMYVTPVGIIDSKFTMMVGTINPAYYTDSYLDIANRRTVINTLNDMFSNVYNDLDDYYNKWILNNPGDTSLVKFQCFSSIPLIAGFRNQQNRIFQYHCLNNSHVEIYDDYRNIYLPKYLDAPDILYQPACINAAEAYRSQAQLNPQTVEPDLNILDDGALHCFTKVIWRSKK